MRFSDNNSLKSMKPFILKLSILLFLPEIFIDFLYIYSISTRLFTCCINLFALPQVLFPFLTYSFHFMTYSFHEPTSSFQQNHIGFSPKEIRYISVKFNESTSIQIINLHFIYVTLVNFG